MRWRAQVWPQGSSLWAGVAEGGDAGLQCGALSRNEAQVQSVWPSCQSHFPEKKVLAEDIGVDLAQLVHTLSLGLVQLGHCAESRCNMTISD